jgi:hypothetical protein
MITNGIQFSHAKTGNRKSTINRYMMHTKIPLLIELMLIPKYFSMRNASERLPVSSRRGKTDFGDYFYYQQVAPLGQIINYHHALPLLPCIPRLANYTHLSRQPSVLSFMNEVVDDGTDDGEYEEGEEGGVSA